MFRAYIQLLPHARPSILAFAVHLHADVRASAACIAKRFLLMPVQQDVARRNASEVTFEFGRKTRTGKRPVIFEKSWARA